MAWTLQVGNLTTDVTWWNRPENMTEENMKRPAYAINTRMGASDLAGEPTLARTRIMQSNFAYTQL